MKFKYVQIGSKDYRRLSDFYIKALDFEETNNVEFLNGNEGVVLKAPGFDEEDPVYFGFIKADKGEVADINDKGYAHTCYETTDVKACVKRLLKYGGSFKSTLKFPTLNPCVYCKDIDGNVVEFHIPFPSPDTKIGLTILSLLGLKHDKAIRTEKGKSNLKFIHVNMICDDWRNLCDFYNNITGSCDFGKLKDHSGGYKEKVIGVKGVHVVGQHILFPNYKLSYPTFEIFTYSIKGRNKVNDEKSLGINAIGFECDDINEDIKKIEKAKGKIIEKGKDFALMTDLQDGRIILKRK